MRENVITDAVFKTVAGDLVSFYKLRDGGKIQVEGCLNFDPNQPIALKSVTYNAETKRIIGDGQEFQVVPRESKLIENAIDIRISDIEQNGFPIWAQLFCPKLICDMIQTALDEGNLISITGKVKDHYRHGMGLIRSSHVTAVDSLGEDYYIITKNSIYHVMW